MTGRRKRMVILTIPTIGALLRDYIGDNMPPDAHAVGIEINPQEQGRLAVVMESDNIPDNAKPVFVHFDLKRVYSI